MKLSPELEWLAKKGLLSREEKEAIFFASSDTPKPVKDFARALRSELERRKQSEVVILAPVINAENQTL